MKTLTLILFMVGGSVSGQSWNGKMNIPFHNYQWTEESQILDPGSALIVMGGTFATTTYLNHSKNYRHMTDTKHDQMTLRVWSFGVSSAIAVGFGVKAFKNNRKEIKRFYKRTVSDIKRNIRFN